MLKYIVVFNRLNEDEVKVHLASRHYSHMVGEKNSGHKCGNILS
jgi:hypothetical protein